MGFLRVLFGIWAGWIVVRIARDYFMGQITKRPEDVKIKPEQATLELLPCPYCGVYTTPPCTNPDCPGKK